MASDIASTRGSTVTCAVLRDHDIRGVLIELSGELDLAGAPEVDGVLSTVEAERPSLVVVDLSRLTFIDSSGLNLLVGVDARLRDRGVRLRIVRGRAQIARLLALTGTDRHLPLVDRVPTGSWAVTSGAGTAASWHDAITDRPSVAP